MAFEANGDGPRDPEFVSITAFGYTFEHLLTGNAQDLKTLESEGAIYSEFADRDEDRKFLGSFTRYRVELTPAEILEYVQAHIAEQEFIKEYDHTKDFTAAVLAIKEPRFRDRVRCSPCWATCHRGPSTDGVRPARRPKPYGSPTANYASGAATSTNGSTGYERNTRREVLRREVLGHPTRQGQDETNIRGPVESRGHNRTRGPSAIRRKRKTSCPICVRPHEPASYLTSIPGCPSR
jgi:hypothetical protein